MPEVSNRKSLAELGFYYGFPEHQPKAFRTQPILSLLNTPWGGIKCWTFFVLVGLKTLTRNENGPGLSAAGTSRGSRHKIRLLSYCHWHLGTFLALPAESNVRSGYLRLLERMIRDIKAAKLS